MITITDATGHSLTLDDAELIVTEIGRMIEDWKQEHHPEPPMSLFDILSEGGARNITTEDTITIRVPRASNDLMRDVAPSTGLAAIMDYHLPPPTSARWEGPPPKRRGRL